MSKYELRPSIEPTEDYAKARKAFWEAFAAIGKLSPIEKDRLLQELLNTEIGASVCAMLANMNFR